MYARARGIGLLSWLISMPARSVNAAQPSAARFGEEKRSSGLARNPLLFFVRPVLLPLFPVLPHACASFLPSLSPAAAAADEPDRKVISIPSTLSPPFPRSRNANCSCRSLARVRASQRRIGTAFLFWAAAVWLGHDDPLRDHTLRRRRYSRVY